jgi:hypothetical protein
LAPANAGVIEPRLRAILADARQRMRHQADLRVGEVRGDLIEVAGRHARVRVAHDQEVVARGARQRDELIDLWIEARLTVLHHDPEPARPAPDRIARHIVGGIGAVAHAEHDLVGGVGERCERPHVADQLVVDPAQRLEDGDGRAVRRRARAAPAQVAPQGDELRGQQRQPARAGCEQTVRQPGCEMRRHFHPFSYGSSLEDDCVVSVPAPLQPRKPCASLRSGPSEGPAPPRRAPRGKAALRSRVQLCSSMITG